MCQPPPMFVSCAGSFSTNATRGSSSMGVKKRFTLMAPNRSAARNCAAGVSCWPRINTTPYSAWASAMAWASELESAFKSTPWISAPQPAHKGMMSTRHLKRCPRVAL